jgi:hypothetical protein
MIVFIAVQSVPEGQQRRVVFEARVTQSEVLGQQKLSGKPEWVQALKLALHAAEVVVMRRARVARIARPRPRGLRFCFRIAVLGFCSSNICKIVFETVRRSI